MIFFYFSVNMQVKFWNSVDYSVGHKIDEWVYRFFFYFLYLIVNKSWQY